MTKILIQHGPQKGQKIENALNSNNVNGAIFSLRDEKIDSILRIHLLILNFIILHTIKM